MTGGCTVGYPSDSLASCLVRLLQDKPVINTCGIHFCTQANVFTQSLWLSMYTSEGVNVAERSAGFLDVSARCRGHFSSSDHVTLNLLQTRRRTDRQQHSSSFYDDDKLLSTTTAKRIRRSSVLNLAAIVQIDEAKTHNKIKYRDLWRSDNIELVRFQCSQDCKI